MKNIVIRGARTHNLKNIDLTIPRDAFVVITGLSGSGKSSLAFDTLYAEGQRRYIESLSAYARQFLSMMEKPDVDSIDGLSPAISIEQKTTSHNPRSTVGTVTEIYDYLRLLFARVGTPHCPEHGHPLKQQTIAQVVEQIMGFGEGTRLYLGAPLVRSQKGTHHQCWEDIQKKGCSVVYCDGAFMPSDDIPELDPKVLHDITAIVDRFLVAQEERARIYDSLETIAAWTGGLISIFQIDADKKIEQEITISLKHGCPECGFSLIELEPRMFSFNSPLGSCESCNGLGFDHQIAPERVVARDLSLSQGALAGFTRQQAFYYDWLVGICLYFDINMDTPFELLSQEQQQILLYGDKSLKKIIKRVKGFSSRPLRVAWEGVIALLQKRFKNTEADSVREQLRPFMEYLPCQSCGGARLKKALRHVKVGPLTIHEVCQYPIAQARQCLAALTLSPGEMAIAQQVITEILSRLGFLVDVGLDYLNLSRAAETLSGGEAQRIRLASQIGSKLVGVLYILDEPSIGLHQRDNDRLIATLRSLVSLGNSVLVVEHDEDAMRAADHLIDIGPGAGQHGGCIIAQGTPLEVAANEKSRTGAYLSGRAKIGAPSARLTPSERGFLHLQGARLHNLKNVSVNIPLGLFTCVTGVSGSGKSSLINHTLVPHLQARLNRERTQAFSPLTALEGVEHIDKMVCIDQAPIGRTPRSNPATYTGLFGPIRDFFAQLPQAKALGFKPGRFSFNVKGGRCEFCEGDGVIKVEMHFLSDIYVTCETCRGKRFNEQTLLVTYKGHSIADVLNMSVDEAAGVFANFPAIYRKLETLQKVGLGYLKIGQNATTLSGGEAQRIKLSKELSKRDTGRTLYVLDEPTTGLHFDDIQQLLAILFELRDRGNTICLIEHHLDVIKTADFIIDMGPEGGHRGGELIYQGIFDDFLDCQTSVTAHFIKEHLKKELKEESNSLSS